MTAQLQMRCWILLFRAITLTFDSLSPEARGRSLPIAAAIDRLIVEMEMLLNPRR